MTDEQYIQIMEEMIATPGWQQLIDESRKQIYQNQCDALEAPNWEKVVELRGRSLQLAEFAALEDIIAMRKQEMETEDAALPL